jgi:hypothetical protein
MDKMTVLAFLCGAFVARMYYTRRIKYIQAESDAWEKRAKQTQDKSYADMWQNISGEIDKAL